MAQSTLPYFDQETGRMVTPLDELITERSRHGETVREAMEWAMVHRKDLCDQHDRFSIAVTDKMPRILKDEFEARRAGVIVSRIENFAAEAEMKMREAGEQVANSEHPFIKLVESILKQKFGNDRTKYAQAMDLAQAQDKELAKSYVERTYPRIGELQKPVSEGGIAEGTRNNDYPQK